MKQYSKLTSMLVVGLCFSSLALTAKEPAPDTLIVDSFEEGNGTPDGWQKGDAVKGVKYLYDTSGGSDGKRSLSLEKTVNGYWPIAAWSRRVDCKPDKKFLKVSAKVKAKKVAKSTIDVQFLDAQGNVVSHEWAAYIGQKDPPRDPMATHDWKSYGQAVAIPPGTKQIAIELQIWGPGKVSFDELEARYVDSKDAADDDKAESRDASAAVPSIAVPEPIEVKAASGGIAQYLLIAPDAKAEAPASGYPVVLVLPGGDGSTDFFPFVNVIHKVALGGKFVVAELIAPGQVVWPTEFSRSYSATTEQAIVAIVDDLAKKMSIDRKQVFALAWSSSGPAIYQSILQESSPITGAFIAMSVFKPETLPPLKKAAGRCVYLLHSPEDKICPYRMAVTAEQQLRSAGVTVTLVDYDGGHGWHGTTQNHIKAGIEWLQKKPAT